VIEPETSPSVGPQPHPVRLIVTDDLRRTRLTVLFRLVLVVPQLIWIAFWGSVIYGETRFAHTGGAVTTAGTLGTVGLAWLVTLFSGWLWPEVHALHVRFVRWSMHLGAYLALIANPWPRLDARDEYPIDLQILGPARQNRWKTAFRFILAIPAIVFTIVLVTVLVALGFVGWFVCLILGRMPKGMRDLGAYCLRYGAQTSAYLLFLTDRYPSLGTGEPVAPEAAVIDHLKQLENLRDGGILTAEEFEAKRRLILGDDDELI
jgi:hypothetical protein